MKRTICRNPEIIDSPIDDELVMMDVDKGAYFGLDSVGVSIWAQLESPISLDELVSRLVKLYEVSPEQCLQDIAPVIDDMVANDLLIES